MRRLDERLALVVETSMNLKRAMSARSALMPQQAIARHMAEGHYDRQIRLSRDTYAKSGRALRSVIAEIV